MNKLDLNQASTNQNFLDKSSMSAFKGSTLKTRLSKEDIPAKLPKDKPRSNSTTRKASKHDIIVLPHDSLRERSKRVPIVNEATLKLVDDMKSATLDWEAGREHEVGVALAAIQINSLHRVIVIREDFNDKENTSFQVYINPEIVKYEGDIEEDFEGCLSVKNVYGKVPRHTKVRVKALGVNGEEIRLRAEGFLARVFQHEIDHTVGKLFVDHIQHTPEAFYRLGEDGSIQELSNSERTKAMKVLFGDEY